MAVVYSLICWGGASGKSVTVSSSTDRVTASRNGTRAGMGLQFTAGTLPTVSGAALAMNTTYYASPYNISEFSLYRDAALTDAINFTSTGSGLVMKSAYYLTLADTSRWTVGSTRVYDGLFSWVAGRSGANAVDVEVAEIGEAFTEYKGGYGGLSTGSIPCAQVRAESKIAGVRTAAFHAGAVSTGGVDAGFILDNDYESVGGDFVGLGHPGDVLDGFTIRQTALYGVVNLLSQWAPTSMSLNMVLVCKGGEYPTSRGIFLGGARSFAFNCLVVGGISGIYGQNYAGSIMAAHCTVVRADVGFDGGSVLGGFFYNNVAVGCTEDWSTSASMSNVEGATNNGGTTGTTWVKGAGATAITVGTSDMANYAGHNYRPASISSPMVDAGIDFYLSFPYDISDAERPSYKGGAALYRDIGCYEFDQGYGPTPGTCNLTLTSLVVGSAIRIEVAATGALVEARTAASSSEAFSITVTGSSDDDLRIKVRKGSSAPFYQPFETLATALVGAQSIYIGQVADE